MKASSKWYTDNTRKLHEIAAHLYARPAGERLLKINLYTSDLTIGTERMDLTLTHAEAMGLVSQLCDIVSRKMIEDERKESKP